MKTILKLCALTLAIIILLILSDMNRSLDIAIERAVAESGLD